MNYLPVIIFVVFFIIVAFGVFSRKGKNFAIKTEFGGTVKEDLGEVGDYSIYLGGNQKVHLLKCQEKDGEEYYILEATTNLPTSKQVSWARVDNQSLQKINNLIK